MTFPEVKRKTGNELTAFPRNMCSASRNMKAIFIF